MPRSLMKFFTCALLSGGMALAGAVDLFASAYSQTGVWSDSEPVFIAFLLAATLIAAGLAGTAWLAPRTVLRKIFHPFVLIAALLAFFSLITTFGAQFPEVSFLGSPQTGEGALRYLCFAAMIAAAFLIKDWMRVWRALIGWYALVILVLAAFSLENNDYLKGLADWPNLVTVIDFYTFNDYLAFHAISVLAIAFVIFKKTRDTLAWLAGISGVVALVVSQNGVAQISAAVVFPCLWIWVNFSEHFLINGINKVAENRRLFISIAIAALPLFVLLVILYTNVLDGVYSLWSRKLLYSILLDDVINDFQSLAMGHGWGRYTDFLIQNLNNLQLGQDASKWTDIYRDQFHSHNVYIETLFAMGIPGLLLVAAGFGALTLYSDPKVLPIAIGYALLISLLSALWFQLPGSLSLVSVAFAAIGKDVRYCQFTRTKMDELRPYFKGGLSLMCIGLVALSGTSLGLLSRFADRIDDVKYCLSADGENAASCPVRIPDDPRKNGYSFGVLLSETSSQPAAASGSRHQQLSNLLTAMSVMPTAQSSIAADVVLVNYYGRIAFASLASSEGALNSVEHAAWKKASFSVLGKAPNRLDIITPYLNWLIAREKGSDFEAAVKQLAAVQPEHVVTRWFLGQLLLMRSNHDAQLQGIQLMKDALRRNLERYMEVPESLKNSLLSQN